MLRKIISILIAVTITVTLGIGLCACGEKPQTATIKLDSNASTGYAWTASQTITDNAGESHCFEISDEYVEPENTGGLVGVPGQQVFTLKAHEEGKVDVKFVYSRSWDPSEEDTYVTYQFEVDKDLQIVCTGSGMGYEDGSILETYDNPPEPVIE